jgi:hypothetical protein
MTVVRTLVLAVAAASLGALAGCVSTRGHLTSDTHQLESDARALAADAGPVPAGPGVAYPTIYARDSVALADSARDLRHAIEDGADGDVRIAFDRVSRAYHAVRDEVEHSDNLQARNDLGPVTEAYRAVENDLGYPPPTARVVVPEDR